MDNKGLDVKDSSGRSNVEGSRQKLDIEEEIYHKKPSKIYLVPLIVLALVAGAVIITLVVIVLERNKLAKEVDDLKKAKPSTAQTCTSKQCVKSAATYLDSVNEDVDPCDNFYEYACGGWLKKTVIPEDRSVYSTFTVLNEELNMKLKELFEREGKQGEPKSITSVRNYYKSCLDLDRINERNAEPLVDLLIDVGGWPVLGNVSGGNWDPTTFHFVTFLAHVDKNYGTDIIIASIVQADEKNSSINVIKLDQTFSLGLDSRDYFLEEKFAKEKAAYLQYMVDVIVELGGNEATAMSEMTDVLELEIAIANMTVPQSERRDIEAMYNVYTLGELNQAFSQINWTLYFDGIMPDKVKPILSTERIIVLSPAYLEKLNEWLPRQDNKVIANYIVWRLVQQVVPELGKTFIDIRQRFKTVLSGTSSTSARWKTCVDDTNNVLAFASGRMYVEESFPAIAKEKTNQMVGNLIAAFKAMLDTNEWLHEEDKIVAKEKADKMKFDIGYPDWILDDAKLDEKYKELFFVAGSHFENTLLFYQWNRADGRAVLRDPVDKESWPVGPAVVNAFYFLQYNRIVFLAGVLQPPFFHHELPWYFNYGAMGVVIGHEITHGFDDMGRQFDGDGNFASWWSAYSVAKFKERKQCIVDQYGGYVMPETNETLNGVQTQGENIADIGGMKESYKAYKDNTAQDQTLPGINLNEDQMFFLAFSQIWCSAYRPEAVTSIIRGGVHSPGRYRVIGSLRNNEDFAKAFNCPSTSYMNPTDKCDVW